MKKSFLLNLIFIFFLSSCSIIAPTRQSTEQIEATDVPATTETEEASHPSLQQTADLVIAALADRDMEIISEVVSPRTGVRFSPYSFLAEQQQVFFPDELANLTDSDQIYTWGFFDGTGEPIDLTFAAYYDKFVYSADFANPEQMAINERLGMGNSINNISEVFPDSSFVEYHFSGFDPQYDGMDWQSLRLVFVQQDGIWYLVGIIHDEWTI